MKKFECPYNPLANCSFNPVDTSNCALGCEQEINRLKELSTTKEVEKEIVRRETKNQILYEIQKRVMTSFCYLGEWSGQKVIAKILEIINARKKQK